jgi:hypothetical protein
MIIDGENYYGSLVPWMFDVNKDADAVKWKENTQLN